VSGIEEYVKSEDIGVFHGKGSFFSLIDKSMPRPIVMWQTLDNGTTIPVDFNSTEGVQCGIASSIGTSRQ